MSHRNQESGSSPAAADRHVWQIPALRDLFWIGLVIALVWFGYYLRSVFIPVLIGLGLAYVFNPLISSAQERWRVPRPVTILGLLAILILGSGGVVAWLGPIVLDQLETLIQRLPSYVQGITDRYELQLDSLTAQLTHMAEQVQQEPLSILQNGVQRHESSLWLSWDSRWHNSLCARFAGLDSCLFFLFCLVFSASALPPCRAICRPAANHSSSKSSARWIRRLAAFSGGGSLSPF